MPSLTLFGSWDSPWRSEAWKDVDDRIRGGKSKSHLVAVERMDHTTFANFYGTLDIKTLGGAGFASQSCGIHWNLHSFSGLAITLMPTASRACKLFTLNIKTEIPQERPDGRRESVVVYEYEFDASEVMGWKAQVQAEKQSSTNSSGSPYESSQEDEKRITSTVDGIIDTESGLKMKTFKATWDDFVPTYRGRPVPRHEAKKLDPSKIKEISIMCRSNFGKQSGDFNLFIADITAYNDKDKSVSSRLQNLGAAWWNWLCGWLMQLFRRRGPSGRDGFIRL